MSIRPKTRKRLLIIGLILFASVAAIGTAYYLRQQQKLKTLVAKRDQGLADYAQGKYVEAFNKLSVWLKDPNRQNDTDLIYKFADTCLQTRDMENHVQIARNWFANYARLRPEDIRGYQNLMDIYYDNRSYTEAIDNADKVIECYAKADPAAQQLLQETLFKARKIRIKSQVALSRFEDALADANAFQKSRPDDVEINRIIIGSLANLKRGSEMIPMATAMYKADPDSPKSLYLLSMAYSLNNDFNIEERTAAWELIQTIDTNSRIRKNVLGDSVNIDNFSKFDAAVICIMKSAALVKGEIPLTQLISNQLDALGLYNESIAVMLKTNPKDQNPWVQSELIARLYDCDLHEEVLKRLENLRVNTQNPSFSNIILMTLKAQCHIVKGQKAEALAISKDLASCPKIDDYVDRIVRAWVDLIGYLSGDQRIESSKLIATVSPAVNNPKYDGYMAFILGNLYSEIGEVDLAIEAYNKAKNSRPTWYAPRLKLSRLYLAVNQKQNAENEANAAHRCYRFTLTFTNLLSVISAINPEATLNDDFMKKIAEYNKQSPNDPQLLPIYLKSLVQTGKTSEAETIVRNLIADEKLQTTDLVRLADLSHSLKLKVAEECLDAAEKKFGLTSDVALMRVSFLVESNKRDEAYAYYEQARAKAPKNDSPIAWKFGYAKILDRFNDPKAVDAWKTLVEDPDLPKTNAYVMVLKTILGSTTAQNDQDLIAKTIDRLKNTTGENAIVWRIAEARFLIKERGKESLTKARALLEETLKSVPSNMDARLLLAGVCDELGDTTSAINNLVEVARSRPEPQFIIQLASLYNKVQDINNVRQTLSRLTLNSSMSDALKVQAASLWIQIGEPERARDFSANITLTEENQDLSLLAVEMELASGQIAKAEERIKNLLKNPTAQVLISAARFYHLTNRDSIASDVLKKFDDLKIDPGMKEYYLGEYASSTNDSKAAIDYFAKAASLQPSRVDCQISYILALIQAGEIEKALAMSDQASRSLNSYKPLEDFRKQRALLISLSTNPLAIRLASEILRNHPESLAAAKSLETLYSVYKSPKAQQIEKLKPIADSALKLFPLQEYMVGLYEQLGRRDDAAAIAVRAAQSNPNSPETLISRHCPSSAAATTVSRSHMPKNGKTSPPARRLQSCWLSMTCCIWATTTKPSNASSRFMPRLPTRFPKQPPPFTRNAFPFWSARKTSTSPKNSSGPIFQMKECGLSPLP